MAIKQLFCTALSQPSLTFCLVHIQIMLFILLLSLLPTVFCQLQSPVDLSHSYDNHTQFWPNGTPFKVIKVNINEVTEEWYAARDFETAEHCGTHLDAPYHFYKNGWKIGDIPPERFFGKGVYIRLAEKAVRDPDYKVTETDFKLWEEKHMEIPQGAIVLLDFGWSQKYSNRDAYFGTSNISDSTSFHFPGLSEGAAKWLAMNRQVYGVGTDTPSIDPGQNENFPAHRALTENSIFILEHVSLPEKGLPATGYQVIALPMKIKEGTGAPCRVIAI